MLLIRTTLMYFSSIFLLRLMGKRHLGDLRPSELVSAILISNLASIPIEDPQAPILMCLAPIVLIVLFELISSSLMFHFPFVNRLICGSEIVVICNGKIDQSALYKLGINMAELLTGLRDKNILDPRTVDLAIMETNGTLTVFEATRSENKKSCENALPVIVDGEIQRRNLALIHKDEKWVYEYLNLNQCKLQHILLGMTNGNEKIEITKKKSH